MFWMLPFIGAMGIAGMLDDSAQEDRRVKEKHQMQQEQHQMAKELYELKKEKLQESKKDLQGECFVHATKSVMFRYRVYHICTNTNCDC